MKEEDAGGGEIVAFGEEEHKCCGENGDAFLAWERR